MSMECRVCDHSRTIGRCYSVESRSGYLRKQDDVVRAKGSFLSSTATCVASNLTQSQYRPCASFRHPSASIS